MQKLVTRVRERFVVLSCSEFGLWVDAAKGVGNCSNKYLSDLPFNLSTKKALQFGTTHSSWFGVNNSTYRFYLCGCTDMQSYNHTPDGWQGVKVTHHMHCLSRDTDTEQTKAFNFFFTFPRKIRFVRKTHPVFHCMTDLSSWKIRA